jgi:GcrA cell cycle regulator
MGGAQMLWTAEAIENLKRLALEGRSASVIAAALGAASRNAVIGKANRIGIKLNGGGGAYTPSGMPAGPYPAPLAANPRPAPVFTKRGSGAAASYELENKRAWMLGEAEVGEMRRVRFEDIRKFACRWPLGDPRSGDFAYCGLKPAEGRSYCAGHCRMAYRPPAGARQSPRERRSPRALAYP